MIDRLILTPVGTSILKHSRKDDVDDQLKYGGMDAVKGFIDNSFVDHFESSPVSDAFPGANLRRTEDNNPAEISSLYAFWQHLVRENSPVSNLRVLFIHSPGIGAACAYGLSKMLLNESYMDTPQNTWQVVPSEELHGLNPLNPQAFLAAMDELGEVVRKTLSAGYDEIYVNLSGGYKALGPYLTMMAMALGEKVKVFYLYEKSPEIIFLPSYPLAFDLLEWRDHRSLLMPFAIKGLLDSNQRRALYKALRFTRVAELLRDDGAGLNSIGRVLDAKYGTAGGRQLSEFGEGRILLHRFTDKAPEEYLTKWCLPRWQHLATGDHIPETVEHGRGHVQRLLELAEQFLIATGNREAGNIEGQQIDLQEHSLTDEQLFVLIGAVWLHDLGHSGNHFTFQGREGLIQDSKNPESCNRFFTQGDPNLVRAYHNFLSYELIMKEQEFLFPLPDDDDTETLLPFSPERMKIVNNSIGLIALYHRKAMPTGKDAHGNNDTVPTRVDRCQVTRRITDFQENEEVIVGFARLAALFRVIDGADNQKERAGNNEYRDVANWVINRQTESMHAYLETRPDDERTRNEWKFKLNQPKHYTKHGLVSHVFAAPLQELDTLDHDFIYDNQHSFHAPVVGVYFISDPGGAADCKNTKCEEKAVFKKIIFSFFKEYCLVAHLLNWRLAIFHLPSPEASREELEQVCITPGSPWKCSTHNPYKLNMHGRLKEE